MTFTLFKKRVKISNMSALIFTLLLASAALGELQPTDPTTTLTLSTSISTAASTSSCLFDERMNALRCRDADLRTVSRGVNDLVHELDVLDANFCHIGSIEGPLLSNGNATVSRLATVNIVNSELESVSDDAFHGLEETMEHLDLSGNLLESIPGAVLHLVRLVSLDLSRNRIAQLPHGSAFNHLNTLVVLNLAENR
jgi:Leucine-rich repeat (LRR) protein